MRFIAREIGIELAVILVISLVLVGWAHAECGKASWYKAGHTTAEGRRYNPDGVSVAHRSYRFGTMLRIVDMGTGKAIVARVGDRGPFIRGRVVDLSRGAANQLGMLHRGVIRVCISRVKG